ncbi:MAG: lantibiotic dehydratase, partial [Candidatus Levyibacteriota bacterium]
PQLFPYLLLRIAGGSYEEFKKTELKKTPRIITDISNLQKKQDQIKEQLSKQLYETIATTKDAKTRQVLIKVRRDTFNDRPITYLSDEVQRTLAKSLQKLLKNYRSLYEKMQMLEKKGEELYAKEIEQSKKVFVKLLQKPNLQNGLLLSSDTILESIRKYIASHPEKKQTISKEERSFMEYVSRMYTKPSPFSTFTHVGLGTFGNSNDTLLSASKKMKVKSHVQLNHALYQYLFGLLVQHKEIRRFLPLKLNFTIKREEDRFVFLTNNRNLESFQRITTTPSLEIFYEIMHAKETWIYNDFIAEIVRRKIINAAQGDIEAYTDKLIAFGFFEFDLGVSGADRNWDVKLGEIVLPLTKETQVVKQLVTVLKQVKKLASQYEQAPPQQREKQLRKAYDIFKNACDLLGATEPVKKTIKNPQDSQKDEIFQRTYSTEFIFKQQKLWYEDTSVSEQMYVSSKVKKSLEALGDLLGRMGPFDGCHEERERMRYFFQSNYGSEEKVDLLRFYEDYYQKIKNSPEGKDIIYPLIEEWKVSNQNTLQSFTHHIKNQLHQDEIQVKQQHIAHMPTISSSTSFGAFIQVYEKEKKPILVLNGTVPGHGKMFSRFLYLFDHRVTDDLLSWNASQENGLLMAEATDASAFNGNLHEPLIPFEIRIPGGNYSLPPSSRIDVNDIAVVYHQGENRLLLEHKKNKQEIVVFDLGFEGTQQRSELFSLLASFTLGSHHNVSPLIKQINNMVEKNMTHDKVIILPRVLFEGQVVLQRKTWQVPQESFLVRSPGENDWTYLLRQNRWRESLGMPEEVFVRKGFEKPQYISFSNPFFVTLFERIIAKANTKLTIEEMLPTTKQTLLVDKEKRTTEFVNQWYIR